MRLGKKLHGNNNRYFLSDLGDTATGKYHRQDKNVSGRRGERDSLITSLLTTQIPTDDPLWSCSQYQ